jgi:hypothetical protein
MRRAVLAYRQFFTNEASRLQCRNARALTFIGPNASFFSNTSSSIRAVHSCICKSEQSDVRSIARHCVPRQDAGASMGLADFDFF